MTHGQALHQNDLLAGIVRNARELVNAADPDGKMLFLNEAGGAFLGIEPAEAPRFHILDVIPDHLRPFVEQHMLPELLQSGRWEGNLQYRNLRTGEVRDFHARCFSITDPRTGAIAGIANVSEDITEKLRIERKQEEINRQLQHADKLESLGVMAGGIAHDFNNLLQAILGNLALAGASLPDLHPARDAIERCVLTARRAADISRQLLTVAGRNGGTAEPVDVSDCVRESTDMLRAVIDRRLSIALSLPESSLRVNAAPGQLQQVIVNLLTNAADAMAGSTGTIRIACRQRIVEGQPLAQEGDIGGPLPPGQYAELDVSDTGCGMDADTLERLFDPFFTTKPHGRGLGMPAVIGIVRGANGHLNVRSAPGTGTRIRICWPLTRDPLPAPSPAPLAENASLPFRGRHFLVVDDEETLRFVATELLRYQGADTTSAASGQEAIRIVESSGMHFDAVLMDISMPGLDGGETFRRLRALKPGLRVLFASGHDAPDVHLRTGNAPGTAFIGKPWQPGELYRALARLLEEDAPPSL